MTRCVALLLLLVPFCGSAADELDCEPDSDLALDVRCTEPRRAESINTFPLVDDDGYRVLFAGAARKLNESDQETIYRSMGLQLAADRKSFVDQECVRDAREELTVEQLTERPPQESDCLGQYSAKTVDLNADGVPEVLITGGNIFNSGATGSSIWLFTRSKSGAWEKQLGFPACCYKILKRKNKGFHDLQIGGMGFCEAIWRWDGSAYRHFRNVPTRKGGCFGRTP